MSCTLNDYGKVSSEFVDHQVSLAQPDPLPNRYVE